jgi:hypothetical protein
MPSPASRSTPWRWRTIGRTTSSFPTSPVSGDPWSEAIVAGREQDYLVCPPQPWLDGINAGDGFVRQFVAVPLGEGLTVEGQLTGAEDQGGLTLSLFAPRPGRFPEEEPESDGDAVGILACAAPMGLGAGGRMRQEIHADEYGAETWEREPSATVHIDLVDALAFEALTGRPAPPPVVDAGTYTRCGLRWFDLIEPTARDIAAAERLRLVRSIADLEVVRLLRLRAQRA